MKSGLQGGFDLRTMDIRGRDNSHRVQFSAIDHLVEILITGSHAQPFPRPVQRRFRLGADGAKLRIGNAKGQIFGVDAAQPTQSRNADTDFLHVTPSFL